MLLTLGTLGINKDYSGKIERLYNTYRYAMYSVAYSILKDKFLAEDSVQQAFVRIIDNLRNIDKIDEESFHKTRSFLTVICRNIAFDIYNKKTNLNSDDLLQQTPDSSYEPSQIIINKESVRTIINEIKKMKPIYQDVMLLRYSHGYSNEEIAMLLAISNDSVRKRLERGKAQLVSALGKGALK